MFSWRYLKPGCCNSALCAYFTYICFFSSVYAVHVTLSVCDLLNVINLHGVLWHGTIPRRFRYLNMTKIDWTAMQVEIDNSNIFIRLLLFHAIELLFYTIKKRLWTWSIVRPQDCWFPIFYLFVYFIGTCTYSLHCALYIVPKYTIVDAYCKILPNISRSLIIYDFIAIQFYSWC